MTHSTIWANDIFFGKRKDDNFRILLRAPKWDCDWYWSFGYLGNNHEHFHLDGYQQHRNINMHDALLKDYDLNPKILSNLWQFCELSLTIYTLKETAEVLGRGGSHMTKNLCADLIKNTDEVTRLNEIVIPKCLDTLYELIK